MGAFTDLWNSERGLLAMVLVIAITVMLLAQRITYTEWRETAVWITGIYTGGKTASSVAAILKGQPTAAPAPAAGGAS